MDYTQSLYREWGNLFAIALLDAGVWWYDDSNCYKGYPRQVSRKCSDKAEVQGETTRDQGKVQRVSDDVG